MKKVTTILTSLLIASSTFAEAQEECVYKTFVYSDEAISAELNNLNFNTGEDRGFILDATLTALKGISSGYVGDLLTFGVNWVAGLVTANSEAKEKWLETVKEESSFNFTIPTLSDYSDFYDSPSTQGAMDPLGMKFSGIGCLKMEGKDTAFFVSCHIDKSHLDEIINHSKFKLVLDTLVINPLRGDLPNTSLDIPYSFKDRGDFNLIITMTLSSSWFDALPQLNKNIELGTFTIDVSVSEKDLDSTGKLVYHRENNDSRYTVCGESFIVPRSQYAYRDLDGNYKDCWGTGQYNIQVDIKQKCGITKDYELRWKDDLKYRESLTNKKGDKKWWKFITNQKWDEKAKAFITTTLMAPANAINEKYDQVIQYTKVSGASNKSQNTGK